MRFLDAIVDSVDKRVSVIKSKESIWIHDMASLDAVRSLKDSLKSSPTLGVIAECKQKSPSKGWLTHAYDPVEQALSYQRDGACAISVLTEPEFFAGDMEHLRQVRANVTIPVLRKDFVRDPVQLVEARVNGADAALLIVRIVDDVRLHDLYQTAQDIGLEVLVEIHSREEAERAMRLQPELLGVNNRDLDSFETRLSFSQDMAEVLDERVLRISESGIQTVDDLVAVQKWGYQAVLIGESLMRGNNLLRTWSNAYHN